MLSTQEIAEKLVLYFNQGDEARVYRELYDKDIVSLEPQGFFQRCSGINELQKKHDWWKENFTVHSASASQPLVADGWFTLVFTMDTTHKVSGIRSETTEVAVYKTSCGKITYEQFFYTED